MNECKGICVRYKAKNYPGRNRYEIGQKRCPRCALFINYPENRCPCCRVKLRVTPRGNKARKQLQIKKEIRWH